MAQSRPAPREGTGGGEEVLFQDLPVVEAAALHTQTLEEAPANVTVITASEIKRYGYRTLGEALAGARGFYLTYDRMYHYAGLRGFSLPGDYNTRFLVMLNGHPLTDNIYNSNGFFGQDFGLDMDLVERIEIIRGPTSALYGSNGIFANINIVTKSPVDHPRFRLNLETGSFGEKKALASSSVYLGKGANLLLAASVFHNAGQSFYFPEFDTPATNSGWAVGVDGERGYHSFANLIWRGWDFTGYFNNREKRPPVGYGDNTFNDRGTVVRDARNFLRAAYRRDLKTGKLRWELYYDQYRYDDRFDFEVDDSVEVVRDINRGDWIGSQMSYAFPVPKFGTLTVGAQTSLEMRNLQYNVVDGTEQGQISHPDQSLALFAQQEYEISPRLKAYFGARFDNTRNFDSFVSPRLALVYQHSRETVYKAIYGRPFRNPSTFEQFYHDDGLSFVAAQPLRAETAHIFEFSAERKFRRFTGIVNFYRYDLNNVIETAFLPDAVQQYRNHESDRSTGVEFEVSSKPWRRLEASASLALQRAVHSTGETLANAPQQVGKFRFAVPLAREKIWLSGGMQYLGPRFTRSRTLLGRVLLADLTATTNRLHRDFDLQVGLRNSLNWRYDDPIYLTLERMRGDGRSLFIRLIWRPWD